MEQLHNDVLRLITTHLPWLDLRSVRMCSRTLKSLITNQMRDDNFCRTRKGARHVVV